MDNTHGTAAGRLFAHTTYNWSLGGFSPAFSKDRMPHGLFLGTFVGISFRCRRGMTSGWKDLARPFPNDCDDLTSPLLMVHTGYTRSSPDSDRVVWTSSAMMIDCLAALQGMERAKEGNHTVINARLWQP